jgi:hypothetical protein
MHSMRSGAILLPALFLFFSWGCGAEQSVESVLVKVKGKATYKGAPLTKGVIEFSPRDVGRVATGDIQPDGTFELTTFKKADGVAPGRHRVAVSGTGSTPAGVANAKKAKELVPIKYTQPETSKIVTEVSKDNTEVVVDFP